MQDFLKKYDAGALLRNSVADFMQDESGMGTVEIILIIVVLIGLVVIFKDAITDVVKDLVDKIGSKASSVAK